MYQHSESVVDLVANSIIRTEDIKNNLYRAYSALLKEKIICDKEMVTLDAWLKDIEQKTIDYWSKGCLLYTSDAADERSSVDLGGRRIINKKKREKQADYGVVIKVRIQQKHEDI